MVCPLAGEAARNYPDYVSEEVWRAVTPYLIPEEHPIKKKLDAIFSKQRAIGDLKSLKRAGFQDNQPQPCSKIIVTTHKSIKGYIFKLYLDTQPYHHATPEYLCWMRRIQGAELIRREIEKQGWQFFFKVPHKWIYPLPPSPTASKEQLQKNFILVAEDMDILDNKENAIKWSSTEVTEYQLDMLYHLVSTLGLLDSCRIKNIPFSHDGKIAFVDTQSSHHWPVHYKNLTPKLHPSLRSYWQKKQ